MKIEVIGVFSFFIDLIIIIFILVYVVLPMIPAYVVSATIIT